ncbi:MAG: kelch repeat-containing protein [Thermomicrobiales bacterium]
MQVGDNSFEDRAPAEVNVAGDADDPDGPTYASFSGLLDQAPHPFDQPISQTIDREGNIGFDSGLEAQNVRIAIVDDVTNHAIPQPFWDFMNANGPVVENGTLRDDALFQNPYFATGRPITEPYWATVRVAVSERQVLVQCFERRCLTYTPGNSPGFITEAGNVGQHYYAWRYGDANPPPAPDVEIPSQASWRQVAVGGGPGSRSDHSLASDVAGGIVYLFGGRSGGADLGDLWAFDVASEQWSLLSEAGPAPRFGHNAIYDARRDRMVIYGGESAAGFFGDVWAWDVASSSWAQIAAGGDGPLARYGAVGTYDGLTNSLIVSHGFTSSGRFDDTWRFDLTTDIWQQISPDTGRTRPEARCLVRGVSDPHHGRLFLFGGQSNTAGYLGDLWEYNLAARNWAPVAGQGPSPRNLYAATAGEDSRYMLVHGGNAGGTAANDLWLLDFATTDWKTLPSTGGEAPSMSGHDAVWTTSGLLVVGSGQTWIAALS